jgi:hypothetical protein
MIESSCWFASRYEASVGSLDVDGCELKIRYYIPSLSQAGGIICTVSYKHQLSPGIVHRGNQQAFALVCLIMHALGGEWWSCLNASDICIKLMPRRAPDHKFIQSICY